MMDISAVIQNLEGKLSVEEKVSITKELSAYLNHLLVNDFAALIQLLYRVDVSEEKLRLVLEQNKNADAGDLLAELVIDRQLQKQQVRNSISPGDDIPDEERW